ncbi:MAG: hypothetical protein GY757_16595 [bacterium]|nr:hypothetical protein [bacterium]
MKLHPVNFFCKVCGLSKGTLSAFLFIFVLATGFAQEETAALAYDAHKYDYTFQGITTEQGLSQDSINCIYQDRTGYLWIGTTSGLNRYDGYDVTVYKTHPTDPLALSNNWVRTICEDNEGFLWIGTDNGLNRLDKERKKITYFKKTPVTFPGLSSNQIFELLVDRDGILWVGMPLGLSRYDREKNRFIPYSLIDPQTKRKKSGVFEIYEEDSGTLWVGSGPDFYEYDRETDKFLSFRERYAGSLPVDFFYNSLKQFFRDSSGEYWIASRGGLLSFNPMDKNYTLYTHNPGDPFSISSDYIEEVLESASGDFWVGTTHNGLSLLNKKTGNFSHITHNSADPKSLGSNHLKTLFEDRSKTVWIGSYGSGLFKVAGNRKPFKSYTHTNDPDSLSNTSVHSIYEDKAGGIWIGTTKGLNKWEREKRRFIRYYHNPKRPGSLGGNSILVVNEDSAGNLWVGTFGGLDRIIKESKEGLECLNYKNEPSNPGSISDNTITAINSDSSGTLWIGTVNGLNKFNPAKNTFTRYFHKQGEPGSLTHNSIYTLLAARSGDLWVGTRGGGLSRFDKKTGRFSNYRADKNQGNYLSNDFVVALYQDKNDMLWVGTVNGLNKFDPLTRSFMHYFEKDGLPDNAIYAIVEDGGGFLWMSTNKGISRFSPKNGTFRNYVKADGLQNNEFNGRASLKTRQGEIFFGGIEGFSTFFPDTIRSNSYVPAVVFSGFQVFNKPLPIEKKGMTLSYREHVFSIQFAALNFIEPSKNQYAYRMEGLDKEWNYFGNRRFVTYTHLAPGDYVFKVKASNNDGLWNEKGASLKITVTPPFWQRVWFKLLGVVFILGIIFSIFRIKVLIIKKRMRREVIHKLKMQRIELEKENLEKELKLKVDFTAMLVHDLRSPLTAIMGYAEMMKEHRERLDIEKTGSVISRSTANMLNLINDMLDLSKFEAGKIELHKACCSLEKTVRDIVEVIYPLQLEKRLNIKYEMEDLADIFIDEYRIAQVLQNLLSNGVKFSPPGGQITLQLRAISKGESRFQELRVIDEGHGIPVDKQDLLFEKYVQLHRNVKHKGSGLGLAVCRLIIEAHGGKIGYEPGETGGSIFYFSLPTEG